MNTLYLPITSLTLVVLTFWLIVLTLRIVAVRKSERISLGNGDSELLQRRVRAHGNLVEYAPFGILLIAVIEAQGGNKAVLAGVAIAFVAGRLLHGYALSFAEDSLKIRVQGMRLTALSLVAGALYALTLLVTAAPAGP